ncbi:S8 family serine peptidase [Actinomadura litoris]|uniref:S8 family serine peptidase n=1 Tax=Actinomadura litoris TaxID=2678616 RepID=UPI0028AEB7F6|nr:S8 family serine peptidase [Actinomadura litoris]
MLTRMRAPVRARTRARVRGAAAVLAAAAVAAPVCGAWVPVAPAAAARADEIRAAQQPILDDLDVPAAWKITRGRGVTVAVVDTGVVGSHPDLAGSVTTGPNMLAPIDAGTKPLQMHGTNMASLIAGHGHGPGGKDGVIGVAPESRVLSIRVIGQKGDPSYRRFRTDERSESAVARGIRHAADHGADVINLSLGESRESAEEREAVGYAIGKGIVVVAAAGNEGDKRGLLDGDGFAPYSYPASYPGVIAVAATDSAHARVPFSNRNYSVLLGAPGIDIPVAGSDGAYYRSGGTSDACALVSGIAALIRARHPKLPPALVSQALIAGTRYGPSGKYGPEIGFGQVNAQRALAAADTLTSARPGAAAGKPARDRFGDAEPGPVAIIDRPGWVNPLILAIIVVGAGGTLAAVAISVAFHRRHPRPALAPAPAGFFGGPTGPPFGGRPGQPPSFGGRSPGAPPHRPPSYMRQPGPAYPPPPNTPPNTPSNTPPGAPSFAPPGPPPNGARPPGEPDDSGDAGGSDGVVGT